MGKSITDLSSVTTVGLDLAKHVFQVHGVDAFGRVIVAKALRRKDVLAFFAQLPRCLVGLEACGSAHHWARELIKLGHDARMMPPAYVNVWPAPSARVFASCLIQSAATYPALGQSQEPRWRSAQPGPHNPTDLMGHLTYQVSRLPFDCEAISRPPLANIVSSSSPYSTRPTKFHTAIGGFTPRLIRCPQRTSPAAAAPPR